MSVAGAEIFSESFPDFADVLLQFGDLAIVRGGRIEAWWPVLAPQHESA